ncbi:MAG: hypothetical protein Q4F38_04150 [Akkermansia sp.]|nr:hypothetical protein [Akkermansia sp.]
MAVRFRTQKDVDSYLRKQNLRRRVLAILMALAIVGGLGFVFCLVRIFIEDKELPSFVLYQHSEEAAADERPQMKEMHSKLSPAVPPMDLIVADSASDTSFMADVEIDAEGLSVDGDALGGGLGDGGLGDGIGEGGGSGMGSSEKTENAFVGRFWDLKKTSAGAASKMKDSSSNTAVLGALSQFYNGGWNTNLFSTYFESKTRLYTSCFYLPCCLDHEATNAYDPKGKMGLKPSRWVALYRARVQAPKTGRFRFIGIADTVMAVRFNNRNVLACGLHDLKTNQWGAFTWDEGRNEGALDGREIIAYDSCEFWNQQMGGFVAGEPFDVTEGEWYEMQVLVSEIGGGNFGFCLLVDDMSDEKVRATEDGKPMFQLFRTSFISPEAAQVYEGIKYKDENVMVDPPYDPDSMLWVARPMKGGNKGK